MKINPPSLIKTNVRIQCYKNIYSIWGYLMNDHLPSVDWNTIKNALVFGIGLNNTMTIRYHNGKIIKEVKGSLFKMSDKDEEIIIKNAEDFYILGYNEIRFAAVNVS